jgi:hypothetical protein
MEAAEEKGLAQDVCSGHSRAAKLAIGGKRLWFYPQSQWFFQPLSHVETAPDLNGGLICSTWNIPIQESFQNCSTWNI